MTRYGDPVDAPKVVRKARGKEADMVRPYVYGPSSAL